MMIALRSFIAQLTSIFFEDALKSFDSCGSKLR